MQKGIYEEVWAREGVALLEARSKAADEGPD